MLGVARFFQKHQERLCLLAYVLAFTSSLFVYFVAAEGQFSGLMTLSSVFQLFAHALKVVPSLQKGGTDISAGSLVLTACSLGFRLSCTTWLNGYLPIDKTGDWLFQLLDIVALAMTLWLLFCSRVLERAVDDEGHGMALVGAIIGSSLMLASVLHADENQRPMFDMLWLASAFLNMGSVIPQFCQIARANGKVAAFMKHSVILTSISQLCHGVFIIRVVMVHDLHFRDWIITLFHFKLALLASHVTAFVLLLDLGYRCVRNDFRRCLARIVESLLLRMRPTIPASRGFLTTCMVLSASFALLLLHMTMHRPTTRTSSLLFKGCAWCFSLCVVSNTGMRTNSLASKTVATRETRKNKAAAAKEARMSKAMNHALIKAAAAKGAKSPAERAETADTSTGPNLPCDAVRIPSIGCGWHATWKNWLSKATLTRAASFQWNVRKYWPPSSGLGALFRENWFMAILLLCPYAVSDIYNLSMLLIGAATFRILFRGITRFTQATVSVTKDACDDTLRSDEDDARVDEDLVADDDWGCAKDDDDDQDEAQDDLIEDAVGTCGADMNRELGGADLNCECVRGGGKVALLPPVRDCGLEWRIKNTFICVDLDVPWTAPRRASSCPPRSMTRVS